METNGYLVGTDAGDADAGADDGDLVVKWPSGRITFAYNCETSSWFMCAGALAAVQGCGATSSVLRVLETAFIYFFGASIGICDAERHH